MDLGIAGKVAIVTGGARGIGRAVVEALVHEGVNVGIFDIWYEGLHDSERWIQRHNRSGKALYVDVADREAVNAATESIIQDLGPPSILINSAAVLDNISRVDRMDASLWQRDLDVNLSGIFHCVQAVLPAMREQAWGRIVTISSVAGIRGGHGQAGYAASKSAAIGLMRTVALEGGRDGITANLVYPGAVGTEAFYALRPDYQERIRHRSVWRMEALPEDIAKPIVFLCSEPARYITGAALDLTGGIDLFTY